MARSIESRIKVVEAVKSGKTMAAVSQEHGVSDRTVRRWFAKFKDGGLERLTRPRPYAPPWNVTSDEIEREVYLIKEKYPRCTLSQARGKLSEMNICLSLKCIWKIWHRYGLAGYDKEKQTGELLPNISLSKDVVIEVHKATEILRQKGGEKAAAQILNRLPYCGGAEILDKIPYRYLGLRRRIEKIPYLYATDSLHKFYQRVHSLRLNLEKGGLFYSSLRAGIWEVNALYWLGKPEQMLALVEILEKNLPQYGAPFLRFSLQLLKGIAFARFLKLQDAVHCASECKRLVKTLSHPSFHLGLGNLYSHIGMYLHAKDYYETAVQNTTGNTRDECLLALAGCYTLNGEYQKATRTLEELKANESLPYTLIPLVHAQALFGQGRLTEATQYLKKAIELAKKAKVLQYLHSATMVLSAVQHALGKRKQARALIRNLIPLLRKHRMTQDYYIRRLYMSKNKIAVPEQYKSEPFIKMILLAGKANQTLRLKDYHCALNFARRKGLTGYFHRLCIFYPEMILRFAEKGKVTGLPRALLRLPIFNKQVPVYHIKILGALVIFKNQEYLTVRLRPKDSAFLIHLANGVPERNQSVRLGDICSNFWPKSRNPARNLSHLLVRIKRALKIPSHLLQVSRRRGESVLINRGINFITDYSEFEQTLATARALERTGEWEFARKEYLRAFKLFRDEPFRKMYDPWSEQMRRVILNKLETETVHFAQSCIEHKNIKDASRILEKVLKIIPDSEEIKNQLKALKVYANNFLTSS